MPKLRGKHAIYKAAIAPIPSAKFTVRKHLIWAPAPTQVNAKELVGEVQAAEEGLEAGAGQAASPPYPVVRLLSRVGLSTPPVLNLIPEGATYLDLASKRDRRLTNSPTGPAVFLFPERSS